MATKKKFLELKEELSKHNNAYYNASPIISDQKYDDLKSQDEIFLDEHPDHLCVEVERRPELPLLQLLLDRAELLRGRPAVNLKDGPCANNGHNLKVVSD